MRIKKRILVFHFDLLSNYLRCIVLMNNHFHRNDGYEKYESEQFEAKKVMGCVEKNNFSWLNEMDLERVLLSQINTIRQFKPDIVIEDVAPTLKMASEITNVKYIALNNGYMKKHYDYTRNLSKIHSAYTYSEKIPEKDFNITANFVESISFKIVHKPFKLEKLLSNFG